ncbi:hypothetical protein [Streptomyces asiaticus]
MDVKRMRRVCAELFRGLNLRVPAEPDILFSALCEEMTKRHDRPVEHRLVPFPAGTVSGLWVATTDRHLMLIEANTAPDHQLVILGHEFWHLEIDAGRVQPVDSTEASALLAPSVDAETVQKIATRVAARTNCGQDDETASELFGSMLGSKGLHWLEDRGRSLPASSTALVHRLHASLGLPEGPGVPQ